MDRSNNGAYSRTHDMTSGRALEDRASVEVHSPRLQKKRSDAGVRNASQPLPSSNSAGLRGSGQGVNGAGDGGKQRKSSLRNAVRKIFGRRSKEVESQPPQRTPPRHGYHRSEPPILSTQVEQPESPRQEEIIPQRTLSAPLQIIPPPTFQVQRTRSPYAVEFPQSARLKPLDLGNPFSAPGSQLRRRKTLPSVLLPEGEAAALSASISSAEAPPVPSIDLDRGTPTPDLSSGLAVSSIKSAKRRSRSASDLKGALVTQESSPPRKRSEEIRYWRESFQGSVLRASGFTVKGPRDEPQDEGSQDKTPTGLASNPFDARARGSSAYGTSPPQRHKSGPSFSDADVRSASGIGTELSRDLEDRVAKLEAGLHNFQRSLQRLTAERNRRTVVVDGVQQRRSSTDLNARTPSMLADTLMDFLPPSSYQYDYQEATRPSTSPAPPRTPVRSTDSSRPAVPPLPFFAQSTEAFSTPPTHPAPSLSQSQRSLHNDSNTTGQQPPQHTFRSLYEMLSDERSARRRLELQLRGLKQEVTDLQYQVSSGAGSAIQSQRSSFIPLDPVIGSSRLRELLRDTEVSPPGTAQSQAGAARESTGSTAAAQTGVVSRFSGSESEPGIVEAEELPTPYEDYRTPVEGPGRFPFGEREGEMF